MKKAEKVAEQITPIINNTFQQDISVEKITKHLITLLENNSESHQTEVQVSKDDIFGYADIVLNGEVVDIKSKRSFFFKKAQEPKYDVNKDLRPDIIQLMTYVWILNKKVGKLICIDRDSLYTTEYVFFLDNWLEEIDKELSQLRNYWDNNILPDPLPRAYNGKECNYCVFKDKCWEMELNELKGGEIDNDSVV